MKPVILVTAGIENTYRNLIQTACYKTYSEAIAAGGGIPLVVSDDSDLEALADLADGLFVTGGGDIHPRLYGGNIDLCDDDIDAWRDDLEFRIVKIFAARRKPIFGICRGMQMINVAFGGTLYEDLLQCTGHEHIMFSTHEVNIRQDSDLDHWFGERILVNSFHHQAVNRLADGFEATAWADDGIIEAMVHRELPIIGVQWHPERMTGENPFTPIGPDMAPLFKGFCEICKASKEDIR